MKNLILIAPPGAGKGTQCELLCKKYGYKHVSPGQLFRELDERNELSENLKETIASGNLVDDLTTLELVKSKLETLKNDAVVLDGFPRNVNQAMMLDQYFKNYVVINIATDYQVLLNRALGRLTCDNCNKIYNSLIDGMAPKSPGLCDLCGVELSKRADDNEESFQTRFQIYTEEVKAILDYYNAKEVLYVIENKSPQETFMDIESVVNQNDNC